MWQIDNSTLKYSTLIYQSSNIILIFTASKLIYHYKLTVMNKGLLTAIQDEVQSMIENAMDRAILTKQPKDPDNDHFISVKIASEMLSVSRVTIYDYIKRGMLKKYKIGSTTRLKKSEVISVVQPV